MRRDDIYEPEKLEPVYQEIPLEVVMRYYVTGFQGDVRSAEWFLDQAKGRVIFRLMVATPTDRSEGDADSL